MAKKKYVTKEVKGSSSKLELSGDNKPVDIKIGYTGGGSLVLCPEYNGV